MQKELENAFALFSENKNTNKKTKIMIGLINSMMNKIEAMISLLKHPFCLISITLTGLDQNARGDRAAPAGSEQLSVWRGQLSVMTWLKLTMSPWCDGPATQVDSFAK